MTTEFNFMLKLEAQDIERILFPFAAYGPKLVT